MKLKKRHPLEEAVSNLGLSREIIIKFVTYKWIIPADQEHMVLDEEDIARINLIYELQHDFGVNDESIPIILLLIDQLNSVG